MNRCLTFSLAISMSLSTLATPLRAATEPRAGKMEKNGVLWTNEDLERLRFPSLISVVGQRAIADEEAASAHSSLYVKTQNPEWYAEQAAELRNELERRQVQLRQYQQALEDVRSLKDTMGGINLDEGDIGITPQAGIEILQQHVNQTQVELDALEDLARHHGIPPGTLRGQ
jgi:hypothetical protein